jgi:hypothetical protein
MNACESCGAPSIRKRCGQCQDRAVDHVIEAHDDLFPDSLPTGADTYAMWVAGLAMWGDMPDRLRAVMKRHLDRANHEWNLMCDADAGNDPFSEDFHARRGDEYADWAQAIAAEFTC